MKDQVWKGRSHENHRVFWQNLVLKHSVLKTCMNTTAERPDDEGEDG